MSELQQTGIVQRFDGVNGWYYVALDEELSKALRPLVSGLWPALLPAEFTVGSTTWKSSIMPIKNGPLFIALPAKVRKKESIKTDSEVCISFRLLV